MKKLTWLIIKSNKQGYGPCPLKQVIRPAQAFKKLIEKETNGSVEVELLTSSQYEAKHGTYLKKVGDVLKALQNDEIQMTQVEVYELGEMDNNFYVFDMPWMFKSHNHASKVLDGKIGYAMNQRLKKHYNIKGLAYTYSGGYRSIGGFKTIPTLEDLAGKNILINGNPVTKDYMESLGVKTTRAKNDDNVDGRDTTYIRFPEATNFLKTNHSLFLTDIIVGTDFWNSLTETEQKAMQDVSNEVAVLERGWTIEDAKEFENTAKENGCEIVEMSKDDQLAMQEKAKDLYKKWESKWFPGLMAGIEKLKQ